MEYRSLRATGRRGRRLLAVSTLACASVALVPALGLAQSGRQVEKIDAAAAKAEIAVERLRGGISALPGSGGNIVVLPGDDGALLVDAGIAVSGPRIRAALGGIGSGPGKLLVNTHYHWDHTDGNAWVHEAGATIVAHENTLARLSAPQRVEEWNHTFAAAPVGARPTVTFTSDKTMEFDGETLELASCGPGHTDGDILVYFKGPDVLVLGDTWWNGYYAMIDLGAGGSIDGMIRWADVALARATETTVIVPGHGPVGFFEDTRYYEHFLQIEPGQILVLYTDGVTEAAGTSGEEYGRERLARITREGSHLGSRELITYIYADILQHTEGRRPTDDVTFVIIRALAGS